MLTFVDIFHKILLLKRKFFLFLKHTKEELSKFYILVSCLNFLSIINFLCILNLIYNLLSPSGFLLNSIKLTREIKHQNYLIKEARRELYLVSKQVEDLGSKDMDNYLLINNYGKKTSEEEFIFIHKKNKTQ